MQKLDKMWTILKPFESAFFRRRHFVLSLLFSITAIVYIPTIQSPFIRDDFPAIVFNGDFRAPRSLSQILFSASYHPTRPLFNLWNFFHVRLFGPCPLPFHISNIFLHLVNGLLVYLLFSCAASFTKHKRGFISKVALLTTGIFLLHPLQTESIAHISAASGTLMTVFYLLSMLFFLKARTRLHPHSSITVKRAKNPGLRCKIYLLCSLFAAIISQFAKESAITLIATMVLLFYLTEDRSAGSDRATPASSNRNVFLLPYILTLAVVPLLLTILPYRHGSIGFHVLDPWLHFVTQWKVLALLVLKFFVPFSLNFDYNFPPARSTFEFLSLLGLSSLILCTLITCRLRKKIALLAPGWIFFLITISPTNSVFPNTDFIAERHLYLPLLGLGASSAALALYLLKGHAAIFSSLCLLAMAGFTLHRTDIWSNDQSLFIDTMKKSPGRLRPVNGLLLSSFYNGDFERTIYIYENLRDEIERNQTHYQAGIAYLVSEKYSDALRAFESSLKIRQKNNPSTMLKEIALWKSGKIKGIRSFPEMSIGISPYDTPAYYAIGITELKSAHFESARAFFLVACNLYFPPACRKLKERWQK